MRVHYLYCHPLPESFHAAIRAEAVAGLEAGGHTVDVSISTRKVSIRYCRRRPAPLPRHDAQSGRPRGLRAPAAGGRCLVLQFPTWCFGLPAMLKGYLDRMIMPVSPSTFRIRPTCGPCSAT